MSKISTVLGEINSEELGFTTMHEHILCDVSAILGSVAKMYATQIPQDLLKLSNENLVYLRSGMGSFSPDCITAGDVDFTVKELSAFKAMGGNTVVDATPLDARGNIAEMQDASRISGVNLITCTGLYITDAQPENFKKMSEDELVVFFEKEVVEGIDDTDVKAAFLKCAINTPNQAGKVDEMEIKAVRACARAAANTGRSIHIHNAYPLTEQHIIPVAEMVLSLGVKPEKILMLHMDSFIRQPLQNIDYIKAFDVKKGVSIDMQLKLLDMGVNIGFDAFDSLVTILPDNNDRLKALVEILKRGYGGQITLGHDTTDKAKGVSYGYTGLTGFIQNALPVLKELGYEDDIYKMTVINPARILAY